MKLSLKRLRKIIKEAVGDTKKWAPPVADWENPKSSEELDNELTDPDGPFAGMSDDWEDDGFIPQQFSVSKPKLSTERRNRRSKVTNEAYGDEYDAPSEAEIDADLASQGLRQASYDEPGWYTVTAGGMKVWATDLDVRENRSRKSKRRIKEGASGSQRLVLVTIDPNLEEEDYELVEPLYNEALDSLKTQFGEFNVEEASTISSAARTQGLTPENMIFVIINVSTPNSEVTELGRVRNVVTKIFRPHHIPVDVKYMSDDRSAWLMQKMQSR